MTKSELIKEVYKNNQNLNKKHIEFIINEVFNQIKIALSDENRVEIRGFGTFHTRINKPKIARNPKTGKQIVTKAKIHPTFKPGKDIKKLLIEKSKELNLK
ncbi:MAG: HU family DNA-binding protein [Deferribacterota bacterium]|nr:HU family DNA-binding protein [Deferribacterota bacterium]